MIVRLSQKLCTKIKAGSLKSMPLDDNPFVDWSAHLFTADRTQYIIMSNTKSLYSTVLFGKGITNNSSFIEHVLSSVRKFMQDDGQQFVYRRFIAPSSGTISFAKALNPSVTSSINELVKYATVCLSDDELSPHEIGFKLNDVLFSAIAPSKAAKYGKPREVFVNLREFIQQ